MALQPLRRIKSCAPIRIADIGGWTDTWFARHGKVLNVAVAPLAEVQIEVFPPDTQPFHLLIQAENYGDSYELQLPQRAWKKHPLLEASIGFMGISKRFSHRIHVSSQAPPGASMGTSAAVAVALIGALDGLRGGDLSAHDVAFAAHHVEMGILGLQSGIQDQLCSAYGGINFIEIEEFPNAKVTPLHPPDQLWSELDRRLVVVYLGKSHSSSEVHAKVIEELKKEGAESPRLASLREAAERGRSALLKGNLEEFGRAMIDNNEAQRRLHSGLISDDALRLIEIARECGAAGWKVNGAGGEGGSLTILCGEDEKAKQEFLTRLEAEEKNFRQLPIQMSRDGLKVWE